MPLIDLKTDLKSVGYGSDRPGGASSNQPYIQSPIPEGRELTSPDFLLRNGYLNPVSSLEDVSRLTKYFTDIKSPNGLLFTAKQELLERQNPKIPGTNRLYTPVSTIAQAGVISSGYHLDKQGLNPFRRSWIDGGDYGYFEEMKRNNSANSDGDFFGGNGRLSMLYEIKKSRIYTSTGQFLLLKAKNLYKPL
jgi:hypothetical protein